MHPYLSLSPSSCRSLSQLRQECKDRLWLRRQQKTQRMDSWGMQIALEEDAVSIAAAAAAAEVCDSWGCGVAGFMSVPFRHCFRRWLRERQTQTRDSQTERETETGIVQISEYSSRLISQGYGKTLQASPMHVLYAQTHAHFLKPLIAFSPLQSINNKYKRSFRDQLNNKPSVKCRLVRM